MGSQGTQTLSVRVLPGSCHLQMWALQTAGSGQKVQCLHDLHSGAMGSRNKGYPGSRIAGSSEITSLRLIRELLNLSYFILRILVGTRIKSRLADPAALLPLGLENLHKFPGKNYL